MGSQNDYILVTVRLKELTPGGSRRLGINTKAAAPLRLRALHGVVHHVSQS